jgi:lipoprotein NlpD
MSKGVVNSVIKIAAMLLLPFLSGCSNSPAGISDRVQPPSIKIKTHRVDVGETLYSIAWRYDLSVNELAYANLLVEPYTLKVGQKLNLKTVKTRHTVTTGDTLFSIASTYGLTVWSLARKNGLSPPYIISPGQVISVDSRSMLSSTSKAIHTVKAKGSAPKNSATQRVIPQTQSAPKPIVYSSNWQWKWPIDGQVVETFNPDKLQKGIKIKSSNGTQVRAAAPGHVVYAGSGLRGYGRLIIIKHSDILLTAYANNDTLLVVVGQSVKQTDVISSLGVDGTMYFEIRKDGDPVNPISYLK